MSKVIVESVTVKNPKSGFLDDIELSVELECVEPVEEASPLLYLSSFLLCADITWKVVYVGSAESSEKDQTLEEFDVGPLEIGRLEFDVTAPAPNITLIPKDDIIGVTLLLLTATYKKQEFCRIGYFVSIRGDDEMTGKGGESNGDGVIDPVHLIRDIRDDEPRMTTFNINW
eukprot:TRINITY_DN1858_c0_g1_i3.p1 TRINITY_DN1858_c0_g1~~TRINITY_DN1858_c0_g1_i3.p1  ORF type:complete len:172 (-),score=57.52 TRINITY_DN1858_c0_g1_i3:129-644(-)